MRGTVIELRHLKGFGLCIRPWTTKVVAKPRCRTDVEQQLFESRLRCKNLSKVTRNQTGDAYDS